MLVTDFHHLLYVSFDILYFVMQTRSKTHANDENDSDAIELKRVLFVV